MAEVLADLSEDLQKMLAQTKPDSVTDAAIGGISIYEAKEVVDMLRGFGYLNVVVQKSKHLNLQAISIEKMKIVDLGLGYKGKKKEVVTSDIISLAQNDEVIRFFHWDGFVSETNMPDFSLINQYFAK